jgi:dihydrodipicolinate reductase
MLMSYCTAATEKWERRCRISFPRNPTSASLRNRSEHGSEPVPFKLYMSPLDCETKADVVIDFSRHDAIEDLLTYA